VKILAEIVKFEVFMLKT